MPGWPTSGPVEVSSSWAAFWSSSVGIWLTIRAGLGVASWEVLHIALAERFGIGIGTASMLVGALPRAARRASSAYDQASGRCSTCS